MYINISLGDFSFDAYFRIDIREGFFAFCVGLERGGAKSRCIHHTARKSDGFFLPSFLPSFLPPFLPSLLAPSMY